MSKTALVLIAHGSRDPDWAAPFQNVCSAVHAKAPDLRVELAFLEFMAPTLLESAELLLSEGFDHIVVLPMFIAQGAHLKEDVPRLINEIRERNPKASFELASALGDSETIVQAMAAHVMTQAGQLTLA